MLKGNSMRSDRDGEHLERVLLLSKNIGGYADELNVNGDDLTDSLSAGADWTAAVTVAHVESGEAKQATEELRAALLDAYSYYMAAKVVLTAKIDIADMGDDIIVEYGIEGHVTRNYEDLYMRISQWLEADRRLVAEGDPRVVDRDIIEGLNLHLANISERWHNSQEAHREKIQARADRISLFERQTILLEAIFGKAKLHWGNDDPRLRDLGFVPRSEVWTRKRIMSSQNFAFDDASGEFFWDPVEGAEEYELQYRPVDVSGRWSLLYSGAESSTKDHPPAPGEYDLRVRAIIGEERGSWSRRITQDF